MSKGLFVGILIGLAVCIFVPTVPNTIKSWTGL